MPRNSSGIYTLPGGNPVTPGDVIEADWANTTLEDVADALTNSLSRTGAGGMLAPFRIADGSVSGPGLSYLNETNTGLYRSGSGSVWMSVLGVNTFQFSTVGVTIPAGKALTAVGNASVGGTLSVVGATTLASTLAVTGAITATGGVLGNVTAASGTSTFNNVTINGNLDMDAGSSGTITNLPNPTNPGDAANKAYVDAQDALRLALTGGTMTGAIAMSNNKVTGVATPTADQDVANKAYVDNVAQGIDAKASCAAATTANVTLSGTQTIDGYALVAGQRVLVKDQSAAAENGIYVVAAGSWARSADADTWEDLVAAFTFIEHGTTNANNGYICTIPATGTLGVTAVTWAQFSGAGQINAGTGMSKTGNTLNVNTASSSRIVVGADEIDLATTGVIADTYKSVTVDQWGRVTGGANPTTLAGFGIGDAYTQTQTNTLLAAKLSTTGGTMSGAIAMGTNKITGLGDPTLAQDAATKNYIDTIFGSTTTAAASAAAAAASASAASSSATSASGSASSASASAAAAAASYDSFDDRYLGAKASDPTVDNDGNALLTGALYWNTTSNQMRVYNGSAWEVAYLPASGYAALASANVFTANQTINANTSSAALSITQAGSGNALYIEDVAADATPFVVSSTGAVGIGTTTPDNVTSAGIALVSNDGYYPQVVNRNKTNDATASYLVFDKDRAGAVVQSGDNLGNIVFRSFDGANYLQSAAIIGYSDGTPGTNDVPGRLSFLTTADGASAPTERLRISNTGALGMSGANYGTAGQVLTSGGSGAAPTWSTPSAGGTATFVATGTISNGQTVALRSDGTIEVVSGSFVAQTAGTLAPVPNTNSQYSGAAYDPINNVLLVAYTGTANNNAYIVAGTVSGTTITFGTEVLLSNAYQANYYIPVVYDAINQVGVVAARASSSLEVRLVSFTVSGTVITVRQTTTNGSATTGYLDLACSTTTGGSFFLTFVDNSANKWTRVQAFTVTSLGVFTLGSSSPAGPSANADYFQPFVSYSSAINRFLVGMYAGSNTFTVYVATVSGTTFTLGASTTSGTFGFGSLNTCVYCPEIDKFAVCYENGSGYPTVRLITATTSSVNMEAPLVVTSNAARSQFQWSPAAGVLAISWQAQFQPWYAASILVSGTTLTLGTTTTIASDQTYNGYSPSAARLTTGRVAFFRQNDNGTRYAQGVILQTSYAITNAANYIGVAAQAISSGATGNVTIAGGVNTGVTGLTVNSKYYVQVNGTLGTTNAGYPLVGRATAATKILVTNSLN